VNLEFNPNERYNLWSGLIAGTFLFLSYFGTDQSQVARYLGGRSVTESRLGLMFNGLLKIPMQFVILFIGVLVYVFYLFNPSPVFHNQVLYNQAKVTGKKESFETLEKNYSELFAAKKVQIDRMVEGIHTGNETEVAESKHALVQLQASESALRSEVKKEIQHVLPNAKVQDRDYIFLNFVLNNLPHGIIGLLLAVMFLAAMSSMAGELNALTSTTTVDVYRRSIRPQADPMHYLNASRWFTIMWAVLAMVFAMLASFAENLIQFVNIIGSLFYGTILGIFLTAFYVKRVQGNAVFWAALVAESVVIYCYFFTDIAFLLYNLIGCAVVITLGLLLQPLMPKRS
jgi:Na+/proline symporter